MDRASSGAEQCRWVKGVKACSVLCIKHLATLHLHVCLLLNRDRAKFPALCIYPQSGWGYMHKALAFQGKKTTFKEKKCPHKRCQDGSQFQRKMLLMKQPGIFVRLSASRLRPHFCLYKAFARACGKCVFLPLKVKRVVLCFKGLQLIRSKS